MIDAKDAGGVSGSYDFAPASNCVWMLAMGGRTGGGDARTLAVLFARSGLRGGTTGGLTCVGGWR